MWNLFWSTHLEKVTAFVAVALWCIGCSGREGLAGLQLMGWTQGVLLQGDSGGCIRELQPYDAAGERYLARLAGEANGFRLCQILFELLLNFLHRNTGFDCGWAGNGTVDLSFSDLAVCCFFLSCLKPRCFSSDSSSDRDGPQGCYLLVVYQGELGFPRGLIRCAAISSTLLKVPMNY